MRSLELCCRQSQRRCVCGTGLKAFSLPELDALEPFLLPAASCSVGSQRTGTHVAPVHPQPGVFRGQNPSWVTPGAAVPSRPPSWRHENEQELVGPA